MTKKTLNLTRGLEVRGKYSNIDFLYGPYTTLQAACKRVVEAIRQKGLTVGILERGSVVEYWWRDGIKDSDLILKNPSKEKVEDLEERVDTLEQGFDQTFTLEEKQRLAGIEAGANNTNDEDVESWGFTKNKGTVTKVRINGQNINPDNNGLIDLGRVDVIQSESKLPSDYQMSSLSNNDLTLNPGDSYDVAFSKLEKNINDNETITAAALNDLNDKINESDNQITEIKSELISEIDSKIDDVNNRLDNLGDLSITENYQLSDLVNEDLDIQSGDKYEQAFGKIEKKIQDNELVTAAALNDLNDRLNNINISISESYESPLSEGGITPNDSYEEAFRKLEDNIQNISKFIGEDIEIIPTLENSIYYKGSNTRLSNFSNYSTFTSSNKSIIKDVYIGNIYYYLLIPQDYSIKIITENNEDITDKFNLINTTITINRIIYNIYEFHLSSNLPLDTNVTINITV